MKRIPQRFPRVFAMALYLVGILISPGPASFAQIPQPTLSVNGSPLVTARPVTRVGAEWFLPIFPIAEVLGAEISMPSDSQLQVRYPNGTEIIYDGRTGQIRCGSVLLGQVNNYRQIQLTGRKEDLLFPLGAVAVLLGVDIVEEPLHGVLRIDSAKTGVAAQAVAAPPVSLTALDYQYGLTTNAKEYSQSISLLGAGFAGNTRLKGNILFDRYPGRPGLNLNRGTLYAELAKERSVALGDQGVYSGLEALTNAVRGIGFALPLQGYVLSLYGGQSMSASFGSLGGSYSRFDTGIGGFGLQKKSKTGEFSFGGNYFSGSQRHGTSIGFAYGRYGTRNRFKSQVLFGVFSARDSRAAGRGDEWLPLSNPVEGPAGAVSVGMNPGISTLPDPANESTAGLRADGPAIGLTLNDTFSPHRRWAISGQLDYYSRNFITPRQESRYSGQSNGALSIIFRPSGNTSLTAGVSKREYLIGNRDSFFSSNLGAFATIPGRHPVQLGLFRSEQISSSASTTKTSLTQLSLVIPKFDRYSAFAFFTETDYPGHRARHLNAGLAIDLRTRGRITLQDQMQWYGSHRWGMEWYLDLPKPGAFIRIGIDRVTAIDTPAGFSPLVGLRLPLPHGHNLELTYYSERNQRSFRLEIGGGLLREAVRERRDVAPGGVVHRAAVTGRVFLDENLNGTFDPSVDRPVADLPVYMDGTQMVATDANGRYRFEQVDPGAHTVKASLEGLPADRIFAQPQQKTIAVLPHRDSILNFGAVRTGRIRGKVIYLDYSRNPDAPVERPFPDAHIIASPKSDSFSELNGLFIIGDLPPGDYEVRLDRESLPPGYETRPPVIRVALEPGKDSPEVSFLLIIPPREVIQKIPPQRTNEVLQVPMTERSVLREIPAAESIAVTHQPASGPLPVGSFPVKNASRDHHLPAFAVAAIPERQKSFSNTAMFSTKRSSAPNNFQIDTLRTRESAATYAKKPQRQGFSFSWPGHLLSLSGHAPWRAIPPASDKYRICDWRMVICDFSFCRMHLTGKLPF